MNGEQYIESLPLSERLQRTSPEIAEQIYPPEIRSYLDNGVIILRQVLDQDLLDRFQNDLNRLPELARVSDHYGRIGIDGRVEHYQARHLRNLGVSDFRDELPGLKLNDLQRYFDSARELAFSGPITAFLETLFGSPAALIQSLTFWKSSEQPLHQDFPYVHHHRRIAQLAAAWIPLEDIDADAGPLVYYGGSHRPDQHGFFDWGGGNILAGRDEALARGADYSAHLAKVIADNGFEPSIYLPKRGDLLIWHGALIHGGTPMRNPALTRRSFVCHYTSVASHAFLQRYRRGDGYEPWEPAPAQAPPPPPPLPRRILGKAKRTLARLVG